MLNWLGYVPVVGIAADAANAVWYATEGNWKQAGFSLGFAALGLIPAGKLIKLGGKVVIKLGSKVVEVVAAKAAARASVKAGAGLAEGEAGSAARSAATGAAKSAGKSSARRSVATAATQAGDDAEQAASSATRGCHSFTANTPVAMADGTTTPIHKIKIGDEVRNSTPDSHASQTHRVTGLIVTTTDRHLVDLTITTPHGPAHLTTTDHHLFYDTTTHHWTPAAHLHPGHRLQTPTTTTRIAGIRRYTTTATTYDLTITHLHTYYVLAGATPVLVHNCSAAEIPSFSAYPRKFLDQAAKYGKGGVRELADGRVRFYGEIAEARTPGEMVGRRLVREWNPDTGAARIWHETLDHAGIVRIVRPDITATGGNKIHYMFDGGGNYAGSW